MNPKTRDLDLTRRRFVGACCASVGSTGLVSTLAQLRLMGGAASPDTLSTPARAGAPAPDFKALVCLFFAGGNDANNLVVPADNAGYAAYSAARTALSLPQSSLLPITTPGGDGRAWALHPAMTELKSLYDRSKLAVIANTGTLAYPLTRETYNARPELRPRQLFSHNDQQVEWQTSVADKPFSEVATGWGGRVADLTNALNSNNRISMMMTLDVSVRSTRAGFCLPGMDCRWRAWPTVSWMASGPASTSVATTWRMSSMPCRKPGWLKKPWSTATSKQRLDEALKRRLRRYCFMRGEEGGTYFSPMMCLRI